MVSELLSFPCGSTLVIADGRLPRCREVIRREVKCLLKLIDEYLGLFESYNKGSPEESLSEHVQLYEEDQREL
jgi:hypothetical protein